MTYLSKQKIQAGIIEILNAEWETIFHDSFAGLQIEKKLIVHDVNNEPVCCYLSLRPVYCDRGHIQLLIDGELNLDYADSFPRYFFNFEEADSHTRNFLLWRLWKHRRNEHTLEDLNTCK